VSIAKEDLDQWKIHPITKEVMAIIRDWRGAYAESLAMGGTFDPDSMEITFGNTAKTIGVIEGLDRILNIAITEGEDDGYESK